MNDETKKCPFCIQDISALATKCPYCQSKIPTSAKSFALHVRPKNDGKRLVLTAFSIFLGFFILMGIAAAISPNTSSSYTSSAPDGRTDTSDLNASVETGVSGIHITNLEGVDWNDCMAGVNGGSGWGFDKPPYRTRINFSLSAGKVIVIPWSKVTTEDGSHFDVHTHTVNKSVVVCNLGGTNMRYWSGSSR